MATQSALSTFKPGGAAFRAFSTAAMRGIKATDALGIPAGAMPSKKLKGIRKYWNREMMDRYIKSGGTELPHDEMCQLKVPDPLVCKADDVAPENKLATEDLEYFYKNGYLKPFKVFEKEEIADFGKRLLDRCDRESEVYPGGDPHRDRHLEMPDMMRLIAHPAIVDRCAQLLGPDLITWRSQLFHKPPGKGPRRLAPGDDVHVRGGVRRTQRLPARHQDDLFMLTVWIPADPSTRENGCLKVDTSSTTERTRWMKLGGDVGFHSVNYGPCYDVKEEDVHYVTMEPGGPDFHGAGHPRQRQKPVGREPDGLQLPRRADGRAGLLPGQEISQIVADGPRLRPQELAAGRGSREDSNKVNRSVPWQDYAGGDPTAGKISDVEAAPATV